MKALVYKDQRLFVEKQEIPEPGLNEALIQIEYAGICQTDVEITKGYMAFNGILGHEFVGEVIESSHRHWVGKRVAGEINIGCGTCALCLQGDSRHCAERSVLGIQDKDGCFAEYLNLPVQNLVEIPETIKGEDAVFTEPLAAACEILEQIHIQPADSVAIVGDGRLAQLISRVLCLLGCRIVMFGKHSEKLQLTSPIEIETCLIDEPIDDQFDIVVEASGSPSGIELAMRLIRPRGTLVLKSTYQELTPLPMAFIVVNEINLVGSRCGRFEPAIRLLKNKMIRVDDLISGIYPIEQYQDAFQCAGQKETLKVVFSIAGN